MDDKKEDIELVVWMNKVLAEQWTGEVFDLELVKTPNIEAKLLQMIDLVQLCTNRVPAKRPEIAKVVEILEEIERE